MIRREDILKMITMAKIPLIAAWLLAFCVYIPMSLSLAFNSPGMILAYAFLAWPLAASIGRPLIASGLTAATILLALGAMNFMAGAPRFVFPAPALLAAALAILLTAPLAATGVVRWLIRRGWNSERAKFAVRAAFLLLATLVFFTTELPYEWREWIAGHTTPEDLIRISTGFALAFVGIWRMTK